MVMFMIVQKGNADNGICIATSAEHVTSLKKDLNSLRHLEAYGGEVFGWRLIPADSERFESDAEKACEMIFKKDPRIGREAKTSKRKRVGPKARK